MALTDKLTAIANAIREKTGGTELLTLDQMPTEIAGIETGGGGASVAEKDVNFIDYDGTVLYAYTVEEAQALTELPALPEREGLICQGWNWSLEDIKAHNRTVNVGAMYITDDGKTRIYISLQEGRTSPMLGVCPNGTVTVDWGDGTEPDVLTGTSLTTAKWTPTHNYASAGDYVISLTVDGEMGLCGSSGTNAQSAILRHSSTADSRNNVYQNAVRKIAIGRGVTAIYGYAFSACGGLTSIVIPNSVTNIGGYVFQNCANLTSVVIPNGITIIDISEFYACHSLKSVVIPNSIASFSSNVFCECRSLSSVVIPDGVPNIDGYAFQECRSLSSVVIPDGVTSIGSKAFQYCHALSSAIISDGVTSIGSTAFQYCRSLSSVVIPDGVTSIGSGAFDGCAGMKLYDFSKCTVVPTLSSANAFNSISADCEIRVPSTLYDEWIAATNWSTYASKIVAV